VLLVLGFIRLGEMCEDYNILVLRYIGCVKPSKVVMMASKTMANLGFGVDITP
jgi:hypothetical protein